LIEILQTGGRYELVNIYSLWSIHIPIRGQEFLRYRWGLVIDSIDRSQSRQAGLGTNPYLIVACGFGQGLTQPYLEP
jgi:hypothetical protein